MRNPNPRQLDEGTIKYFMRRPNQVYDMIRELKDDISKLASDSSKLRGKEHSLAQWRYIKWRIQEKKLNNKEVVVFT